MASVTKQAKGGGSNVYNYFKHKYQSKKGIIYQLCRFAKFCDRNNISFIRFMIWLNTDYWKNKPFGFMKDSFSKKISAKPTKNIYDEEDNKYA